MEDITIKEEPITLYMITAACMRKTIAIPSRKNQSQEYYIIENGISGSDLSNYSDSHPRKLEIFTKVTLRGGLIKSRKKSQKFRFVYSAKPYHVAQSDFFFQASGSD